MDRSAIIRIDDDPVIRYWFGAGSLGGPRSISGKATYSTAYSADNNESHIWEGSGEAFDFSGYTLQLGTPDHRSTLTLSGIPAHLRAFFLQDHGPLPISIKYIYRPRASEIWTEVPNAGFAGVFSNVDLAEGQIIMELETLQGDADRGRPRYWSHEDQRYRVPPTGWETSDSYDIGRTVLNIRGGTELIYPGSTFGFANHDTVYTVQSSDFGQVTMVGAEGLRSYVPAGSDIIVQSMPEDLGMEYMRQLASSGFGTTWPP